MTKRWCDDNLLKRIDEADRTRFVRSNPNLSDTERNNIIDTFKKYDGIDKDIKWGSKDVNNWNYDKFKPYIDRAGKTKSSAIKNGLNGLTLEKDYAILAKGNDWIAYQPLTHLGSKVLASNKVKPEIYPKSMAMDWSKEEDVSGGAKWCIAMNNSSYWDDYTSSSNKSSVKFIFYFTDNQNISEEFRKVAFTIDNTNKCVQITDASDCQFDAVDGSIESIRGFISEDFCKKFNSIVANLREYPIPDDALVFNNDTQRYDVPDPKKILNFKALLKDGRISYPLGNWMGDLSIIGINTPFSLEENFPTYVHGSISIKDCRGIKTLRGVGQCNKANEFYVSKCPSLVSVDESPKEVEDMIYIAECKKLKTLGNLGSSSCNVCILYSLSSLETIDGMPGKIVDDLRIEDCPKLISLDGLRNSDVSSASISISSCSSVTSLEACPKKINGTLSLSNCNGIESLRGLENTYMKGLYISRCRGLKTLDGIPRVIYGSFECDGCSNLTDIEALKDVEVTGQYFSFYSNKVKIPKKEVASFVNITNDDCYITTSAGY